MRRRYFAAMGLAVVPVAACTKEAPGSTANVNVSADPTTTTTAATIATATPTPSQTTAASAPGAAGTPPSPNQMRMPSCPNGAFCVAQPRTVAADAGAPAPFAMCAATVAVPADAGVFGSPYVTFREDATKQTRAHDPKACCYTWVIPCPGGRPLRAVDGGALVATSVERDDWTARAVRDAARCDDADREDRARRWTREAAFEHASIASFARATLDLLALGAPATLVAQAQRAALDEIEHAKIAYALASAFSGRSVGPGPLPLEARAEAVTLRCVVREAIVEGCIGEAAAALAFREEATREDAAMATLLDRIADDEERHAALAYATVAWAWSIEPAMVRDVIDEELARERHGVQARVAREIAEPCLRALANVTTSSEDRQPVSLRG